MDKLARAYADMIFLATVSEKDKPQIQTSTAPINIFLASPKKAHKNINKDMLFSRKSYTETSKLLSLLKNCEDSRIKLTTSVKRHLIK